MHTPLCFTCATREVAAPFTFRDGSGFCSQECEASANEEAADHFAELEKEHYDALLARQYSEDAHLDAAFEDRYDYGNDADITCWEFDG